MIHHMLGAEFRQLQAIITDCGLVDSISLIAKNSTNHCAIKVLRDGESNPGLPRDRRGYSPLYYRGVIMISS